MGSLRLSAMDTEPSTWGAVMSNPGLGETSRPSLRVMRSRYLQGQLQTEVFRVVAEHGPGGAEEDVVHSAVLILDMMLWGPGLCQSLRVHCVHVCTCLQCAHMYMCTHMGAYVGEYLYTVCARTCMCTYVCVWECVHTRVCARVCESIYTFRNRQMFL